MKVVKIKAHRMKTHRFPLLLTILILGSFLLSACSGTVVNSWPGVSATQNNVYLAFQGEIYAINASNGALAWRFPAKADASKPFYAAPAISDALIAAGNYGHMLYGIDPASGTQKWAYDSKTGYFTGTPLIVNDVVLAPSSNSWLYAVSALDGRELWKFETGNSLWATPVSDGTNAYIAALDHNLYALSLKDGSLVWKKDLGSAMANGALLTKEGNLYVSNLEGEVVALDTAGTVLWTAKTGGRIWSVPLLHEDTIYVGNSANKVTAIAVKDGSITWQKDAGAPIIAGGVVLDNAVAFPTEAGNLVAWSLDGSKQTWSQTIGGKLYTTPVVVGNTAVVAVTQGDKLLQAVSPNGQLSWTFVQPK